jgi:hypothetical protein
VDDAVLAEDLGGARDPRSRAGEGVALVLVAQPDPVAGVLDGAGEQGGDGAGGHGCQLACWAARVRSSTAGSASRTGSTTMPARISGTDRRRSRPWFIATAATTRRSRR